MVDGKLQEKTYKDLLKSGQGPWMPYSGSIQEGKQGGKGWLGITDKYWLAAIIPSNHADGRFVAEGASPNQSDVYKVEVRENSWLNGANAPALPTLEPGQSRTYGNWHLFLGPKKVSLLEDYEKKLNIDLPSEKNICFDKTHVFPVVIIATAGGQFCAGHFNHDHCHQNCAFPSLCALVSFDVTHAPAATTNPGLENTFCR